MSEKDRWIEIARNLDLSFEEGLKPYMDRAELLSRLQGERIDFNYGLVNSVMGGMVEQMLTQAMVGIMTGTVEAASPGAAKTGERFELLVYRDIKQRIGDNRPVDEYFMNFALLFPKGPQFELEIKAGRRLLFKNKVRTGDPELDKSLKIKCSDPQTAQACFDNRSLTAALKRLYAFSPKFIIRSPGIIYQEQSGTVTATSVKTALYEMTENAHTLAVALAKESPK